MSPRESLLPEALERLNLFDVAKACGIEIKVGLQKSPFRSDEKKSFSVQKNRTGWRDFATDEGGSIWAFAEKAMPNAQRGELARFLIGLAGFDQESPAGGVALPPPVLRRKDKPRAFAHAKPWAPLVERRWIDGQGAVNQHAVAALAARRGWPEAFVHSLIGMGALAYPVLPWHEPSEQGARHGWAFKVERARLADGRLTRTAVGYHQTHEVFDKGTGKARKSFVYVPYEPEAEKQRTTFQRFLRGTVPPYPFILGSRKPELLVFFEGQWDAVTFYLAADGQDNQPWAVVGLRGAQSVEATLETLGPYIALRRPHCWLWPDNDRAGQTWLHNPPDKPACLRDRLAAAGASSVKVMQTLPMPMRDGKTAKDFNDLYRVAPYTREELLSLAAYQGYGDAFMGVVS